GARRRARADRLLRGRRHGARRPGRALRRRDVRAAEM
ncbi:MAG: hypothetical protein AVDCRST_MAG64-380, partial [uncultured Phycisphaerae bacterium]